MLDALGRNIGVMFLACMAAALAVPLYFALGSVFSGAVFRAGVEDLPRGIALLMFVSSGVALFVLIFGYLWLPVLWFAKRWGLIGKAAAVALTPVFVTLLMAWSEHDAGEAWPSPTKYIDVWIPVTGAALLYYWIDGSIRWRTRKQGQR